MIDLDDASSVASLDPARMLDAVERTPTQWSEALRRAHDIDGLRSASGMRAVVYCGMGGSGVAGDVLQSLAALVATVPVAVVKGYDLPRYAGPDTLVICGSYSGNTEETLSCFDQAVEQGARVVAITTGGALAERAAAHGFPVLAPIEGLQPRAALASLTVPTLVAAAGTGLLPDVAADLAEAEEVLAARAEDLSRHSPDNEAKRLARALDGRLPLVWGQDGFLAVAAVRWRCQINENAKMPAFSSVLPELDHNELVGYDPGVPALEQVALVVLRAPGEHPRVTKRIEATLAAMGDRVGSVHDAWAVGRSPLARLLSSILLGDFTSVYLALLREVDPTPVKVIEQLKRDLAG